MNAWTLFNAAFGCLIFGFIAWQGWLVVKYIFLYITKPDTSRKFPILALLIFILCCGFFVIAFILDYTGSL